MNRSMISIEYMPSTPHSVVVESRSLSVHVLLFVCHDYADPLDLIGFAPLPKAGVVDHNRCGQCEHKGDDDIDEYTPRQTRQELRLPRVSLPNLTILKHADCQPIKQEAPHDNHADNE